MKKLLTVATTLMLTTSVCVPTISKAAIPARTMGIFSEFADGFKEGWSGKKEPSKKKYKKMCKSYNYSKLKKGKYKGKKIKIKGKIENVKEDTLDSDLTVIVKSGGKYYEVYMSQGSPRILWLQKRKNAFRVGNCKKNRLLCRKEKWKEKQKNDNTIYQIKIR